MIVHRDELFGIAPGGTGPTLAGWHVDPVRLEEIRQARTREGWQALEAIPCRACAVPVAA